MKTVTEKAIDAMNKASDNLAETVNSITGTNVITIYSVLKESKVAFTKEDATEIGIRVKKEIAPVGKIKQAETWGDKTQYAHVNSFCMSEADNIQGIIIEYFQQKLAK